MKSVFTIVIPTVVWASILACEFPTFDGTHPWKANEDIETNTNFLGDIHSRADDKQWKPISTHEVDLWQQWIDFDEHQDQHPCLWLALRMNGFSCSHEAIFVVWLSHPHYFNRLKGTSLSAVNQLLKPQLREAVIAEPGVKPSFCWREKTGKGHFEATKDRPQKGDQE